MSGWKMRANRLNAHEAIIQDLKHFFADINTDVVSIEPNSESETRFYKIYFNSSQPVDFDVLEKKLSKYGYTPKRLVGSFYLMVLRVKEL